MNIKQIALSVMLAFPSVTSAQVDPSSLAIGGIIDQVREAGEELISQGQFALNDNLVTAGQVAIAAANALATAYQGQLNRTFAEIEATNDQLSDELRRLLESTETPIQSAKEIVNASGAVTARVPLASEVPAITGIESTLIDMGSGAFEITLTGFNFEFGEIYITAPDLNITVTERLSTSIRLSGSLKSGADLNLADGFYNRLPINFEFVNEGGWLSSDEKVEFVYSVTAVDWDAVEGRVSYNSEVTDRIYSDVLTQRGSHPRVGRRHQYQVDAVPSNPNKIDPESFRISEWWAHTECQNRNTGYTIQEVSTQRIRVYVYGKEEGGWDKDCGTRLAYDYRTYKEVRRTVTNTSEWQEFDYDGGMTYPDRSEFNQLEIRLPTGKVLSFSEDAPPPVGFLSLVDAEEIRKVTLRPNL